jgi:hypothetical protein
MCPKYGGKGRWYLEGAVLKVLLDICREVLVFLHILFHGNFILKLCDKLLVYCNTLAFGVRSSVKIPLPLPSCLLAAEMWKEAVSLGTDCLHTGWKAAVCLNREGCGRIALVEKRAAERGAERARFRRANIADRREGILMNETEGRK